MARARKMKAQTRSTLSQLSGPLSWRYGRDLSDAARRGQLDAVIGRDSELARCPLVRQATPPTPVALRASS